MTFLSAEQDLQVRTLASLSGWLRRLAYLGGLRAAGGRYEHWGLSQVHGDDAAQRALAKAHTEAFLAVLRQPLRSLLAEGDAEAAQENAAALQADLLRAVPADMGGGRAAHLRSVLVAVSHAAAAKQDATRRAA